jgi:hypothetical protein
VIYSSNLTKNFNFFEKKFEKKFEKVFRKFLEKVKKRD